jgi:hypothetical protein
METYKVKIYDIEKNEKDLSKSKILDTFTILDTEIPKTIVDNVSKSLDDTKLIMTPVIIDPLDNGIILNVIDDSQCKYSIKITKT